MVDTYRIKITWVGMEDKPLHLGFISPPTRKLIKKMLRERWSAAPVEDQDNMWEAILIADFFPEHPWLGIVTTYYGTIESYIERLYWNV